MILSQFLECPGCGAEVECFWRPDAVEPEDMDEAPVARQTCACGHEWEAEYAGFMLYGESGG